VGSDGEGDAPNTHVVVNHVVFRRELIGWAVLVDEMRYEFNQPFIVDSTKAQPRLGLEPTPIGNAIASTVAWFRAHDANHRQQQ
jgi:nucleoside-diphosphate-sugar epimerase